MRERQEKLDDGICSCCKKERLVIVKRALVCLVCDHARTWRREG